MAYLTVPNFVTFHRIGSFLERNNPFTNDNDQATLELHPTWVHLEPIGLAMIAAWGGWCRRYGKTIVVRNLGRHAAYAARMRLFDHLGIEFKLGMVEHEEAGRFLPLRQVQERSQIAGIIGDISALLHLEDDQESLAAVQYCISELLRNVLEHSNSPEGAFVCAHRYTKKQPHRVTIAVADCGQGVASHLGKVYPEALRSDLAALGMALRPGVTGAIPGIYGTPDNAGAGLFFTRGIAKGTGGYFLIVSGSAAYRLRRARNPKDQIMLDFDPYDDGRGDRWALSSPWQGTAVSLEVRTDQIAEYQGFFRWISNQIPQRRSAHRRIQFT